jgi:hypothetical protein
MDDAFRRSEEERFISSLNELDAAKALTRKLHVELGNAVSALACSGRSPDCLSTFENAKRTMNEATVRYRRAVDSFNVFCEKRSEAVVNVAHATVFYE